MKYHSVSLWILTSYFKKFVLHNAHCGDNPKKDFDLDTTSSVGTIAATWLRALSCNDDNCTFGNSSCEMSFSKCTRSSTWISSICGLWFIQVRLFLSCRAIVSYDSKPGSAEEKTIPAKGKALIDTQISIAVPSGTYGRVAPRSGLGMCF